MTCQWCGSYRNVRPVRVEGQLRAVLCSACFHIWAESGQRPPAYRIRGPRPGPLTGIPLDAKRLRGLRL